MAEFDPENNPSPSQAKSDSTMSEEERSIHFGFMKEALSMAQLAFETGETPVGCVFVHNGTIIGRGMNATNRTFNGTRHAEFEAVSEMFSLNQKTRDQPKAMKYNPEILKECDLYVTVEPCIMCASMLRQFGIGKVYFGASNDKFGGTGGVLNIHRANGKLGAGVGLEEGDYEISGGWLREEAIVMLRKFYVQENGRAPEPRDKKNRVLKMEVEPVVNSQEAQAQALEKTEPLE